MFLQRQLLITFVMFPFPPVFVRPLLLDDMLSRGRGRGTPQLCKPNCAFCFLAGCYFVDVLI